MSIIILQMLGAMYITALTLIAFGLYEVNKKYRKALENIASAEYDMNKLVSIAIRALH